MKTTERAFGTKLVTIIEKVNIKKTFEEAEKFRNERPNTLPPDPITFQQQKKEISVQEKEKKLME